LKNKNNDPYIESRCFDCQVRLIDTSNELEKNKHYGSISMTEAQNLAKAANLDLVCFGRASGNNLAFYKILNFGKWKYETSKKKKKQQKENKRTTKEIRVSPDIGDHDLEHKMKQANKFLDEGDDVLFTMRLKGRQRAHSKEAQVKILEIGAMIEDTEITWKKLDGTSNYSVRIAKVKIQK
jgi:translation initiation factor IF-3